MPHPQHHALSAFPATPRLPVFGWATLSGAKAAPTSCLLDRPDAVYTTSGRASILLAMEQLGVHAGNQVLMPTYHCPTMIAPAEALGSRVTFYPITDSGAPDMAWLEKLDTSKARLMLAAHYFGLPQPMSELRRWCDGRGIALIEDCAHALFGRSEGRPIGSWGDVAIGSLTKFLPVPEGGCWVSNAPGLAAPPLLARGPVTHVKAGVDILDVGVQYRRLFGLHAVLGGAMALVRSLRAGPRPEGDPPSIQDEDGPEPMDGFTIDSQLAHQRLTHPSRWLSRWAPRGRNVLLRRRNYRLLAEALPACEGFRPLFPLLPEHSAPYVFPLWVRTPDPGYSRLREMRFPVSRWDRLWPSTPRLPGDAGVDWSHHLLQLACHQDLSAADMARIAEVVHRLFAQPGPGPAHPPAALSSDN